MGLGLRLGSWLVCGVAPGLPAAALPALIDLPDRPIAPVAPAIAPESSVYSLDPKRNSTDRDQFEQACRDYGAGRWAAAAAGWQRAARQAAERGHWPSQAAALNGLSLALGQLGDRAGASRAVEQSLTLLASVRSPQADLLRAAALNQRARLELAAGQATQAVQTLSQAATLYRARGDRAGVMGTALNQAQALQLLGLYGRSLATIEAQVNLDRGPGDRLQGLGLLAAGESLRGLGQLDRSLAVLERARSILDPGLPADRVAVQLAIARTRGLLARQARHQRNLADPQVAALQQAALSAFDQVIALARQQNPQAIQWVWAQFERWDLLQPLPNKEATPIKPSKPSTEELGAIATTLAGLPSGRDRVAAELRLAHWQAAISDRATAANTLVQAAERALALGDRRMAAAAWGELGELARQQGQLTPAARWLDRALALVEGLAVPEVSYRYARSLGQLRAQQGDRPGAIAAYRQATQAIAQLRNDLAGTDPTTQFSFRDRVEPIYREFVDQLLSDNPSQEDLQAARSTIEALQLVELENFFRQACLDARPEPIDQAIDGRTDTAAIEAIVLDNRVATILKLPGQPLQYASVPVPKAQVLKALQQLQRAVQDPSISSRDRLRLSQQVYQWLVAPMITQLDRAGVDTLVFVLDGALANIPIAALHDGQRYLLERYNTSRALGLQLFAPKASDPRSLSVLAAGVAEAAPSFDQERLDPLPFVADELEILTAALPSLTLRDRALTETAFRQALQDSNAPIVHIATHAQFSSQADRTFLLAWDRRIALGEFDQLLRRPARRPPIELLVLSACETARGDDRATLGLTGIAIQAGTRSVLGTLWQVSDESTALLMGDFYQQLRAGTTKAEALRQAQLALLNNPNFRHPFYWAPYLLVGNWL
ncbi:MAG: CHAT domain-containing protein [Oscillatoriales cyanobacterium]|nr:MAG: CHAT domain-containing protein [Oscillatoriales cyanobacterium]